MRACRPALTLVEVTLVLALLVVIGAIVTPILAGSLADARLRHSGDVVRAAWGKARVAAMQSGDPYLFRCEPNGSRYQVERLSALTAEGADAANELAPDDFDEAEYHDADLLRLSRSRLPPGIVFATVEVSAVPQVAAAATTAAGWSLPIVFYPHGTTSDAVVHLSNAEGTQLRLTLRGLTGSSRAGTLGEVTP